MNKEQGFIQYIVIMAVILAIAFLGVNAYSWQAGKNLISGVSDQAKTYLSKGSGWVADNVFPKISGEVQKRGDMIKEEVNQEKEKISESIGEKIQNYFSGIAESVVHPGSPQNCEPAQTSSGQ